MQTRHFLLPCIVGLAALASTEVRGAVAFSYVTESTSYSAAAGATVPVNIYLKETLTGGSTDVIFPDGGLITAGAALNATGFTGATAASFTSASYTIASPFSTPDAYSVYNINGGNNAELQELTGIGSYANVNGNEEILLGTLGIKVGSGTTTYSLTSINNDTISGGSGGEADGYTVTRKGTDLDPNGSNFERTAFTGADAAAPSIFTVSALPEPASLSALGLGGLALLRRLRA